MARLEPVSPNHSASATAMTGISTSLRNTAIEAARLGRNMPSRCRPAPVTRRPMASEERPSASATSCQSLGSGIWVTLSASPIAQAQIRGLRTTVMTMEPAERFSGEA